MARILAWDIEASNLTADFGMVLCVGYKEVGHGRPKVISILDYDESNPLKAERRLLKDLTKVLLAADVWTYQFGMYYDLPFINSRLLYHRLPILPPNFPAVDTWKVTRNRLKLRNNRLVTVSEFLGTKDEKNPIKGEQWIRALTGHRPSMRYIIEHCRLDVLVLEEVYLRLRPLVMDHPHMAFGRGTCGACGSKRVRYGGHHLTKTKRFRRFQCLKCGKWDHEKKPVQTVGDGDVERRMESSRQRQRQRR